jgi:hypothetical protein
MWLFFGSVKEYWTIFFPLPVSERWLLYLCIENRFVIQSYSSVLKLHHFWVAPMYPEVEIRVNHSKSVLEASFKTGVIKNTLDSMKITCVIKQIHHLGWYGLFKSAFYTLKGINWIYQPMFNCKLNKNVQSWSENMITMWM